MNFFNNKKLYLQVISSRLVWEADNMGPRLWILDIKAWSGGAGSGGVVGGG